MLNKNLPFKIREEVPKTSFIAKTLILLAFFLLFSATTHAQSPFKTESDAVKFMEGKTFVKGKVRISYGHISKFNTYGFTVIDALGQTLHFTNCKFIPCGHYCDIILEKGYGKGRYRLFPDRLVTYYDMGLSNFITFYISEE
jgi:hypothetical protein